MTDFYVRSATGSDTNDGLSWATAKAGIIAGAALAVSAGDRVFISSSHVDPGTSAKSVVSPGVPSAPVQILSVDDTSLAPGALVKTTGTATLSFQGSLIAHGLTVAAGSTSSSTSILLATSSSVDAIQVYNDCNFDMLSFGNAGNIVIGSGSGSNSARSRVVWNNCNVRFSQTAQRIEAYQEFTWRGGSFVAGSPMSALFRTSATGRGSVVVIEGVDLTGLPTTADLINGPLAAGRILFRNCSLPAGWTGQLVQGAPDPGFRAEMHNCDSGDTNYRRWDVGFSGMLRSETVVVKTGGSSDGATPFSLKFSTNANPTPGLVGFESPDIWKWNDIVDSPVTVSIDIANDGFSLTNAEVWLDVQYQGTSGLPKSSFAINKVTPLGVPAAHPVSSASWNTPGFASVRRQRLSVTVTPREAGPIYARIVVAKPNADLYVDAELQVS